MSISTNCVSSGQTEETQIIKVGHFKSKMSLSKSAHMEHAQTVVSCNVCDEDVPGQYYCIDCKQTLCTQCEKFHGKVASSKNHRVVSRAEKGQTMTMSCSDHGEEISFHCEKCKTPACCKCVTDNHKGHEMSDLNVLVQRKTEVLQSYINKLKAEVLPVMKERGQEIKKEKQNYEKKIQQVQEDMEEEKQAIHKELDGIHRERLERIGNIKKSNLLIFDKTESTMKTKIERCEGRISEYEKAIAKKSIPAVLEFATTMEPIPEIGCKQDFPKPPSFVPGDIKKLIGIVGKFHDISITTRPKAIQQRTLNIIAKFESPLNGWPSICISKKGDIYLGGTESRKLVRVDKEGQILRKRYKQYTTRALAIMDCNDIIVSPDHSDSSSVGKLMANDNEHILFNLSPSYCSGMSITTDQKILISTHNGRVFKTNGDGTNIKLIYKGAGTDSTVHAVEDSVGNIYINDKAKHEVVIIKKDGTVSSLKQTVNGKGLGELIGLVVDNMGNILCADRSNHCVYIIDKNQQIGKLVDSSHGLRGPRWLAIDNENNLWITQYDRNVLAVKYLTK